MTTTRDKIKAALLADANTTVDYLIDVMVALGSAESWDSATPEVVSEMLDELLDEVGISAPSVGESEGQDYWELVGEPEREDIEALTHVEIDGVVVAHARHIEAPTRED